MRKKVSILGSTGSIGFNTLKIFKNKKLFKINVLIADKNYNAICKQIKMFQPTIFVINNPQILRKVKNKFKKNKVKIISPNNIKKNIKINSDITVAAISGIAGLYPTIEMIKKSKKVPNIIIANLYR